MRAALFLVGLAACGFEHGQFPQTGGDGGSGSKLDGGPPSEGAICGWSYAPTNFDPCMLPAPGSLTVSNNSMLDVNTSNQPKKVLTQSDGTMITVIHLSQLTVDPFVTLTLNGSSGVVFAVDGDVTINGNLIAVAGSDNATQCASGRGGTAGDSTNPNSGGGGGGGGAGADDGGGGGAGEGTSSGAAGMPGTKATSTLSPLRGGCRGGQGGRRDTSGVSPMGGRGGGAIQISSNTKITVNGFIDASGRGGSGGTATGVGAGGGGSGGGVFIEAPNIGLGFASGLCADGGSGGEGGGASAGANGEPGACTAFGRAQTSNSDTNQGGNGGDGGYRFGTSGAAGQAGQGGGAGGGGGGGGVGWVRVKSPNVDDSGSVITPAPAN